MHTNFCALWSDLDAAGLRGFGAKVVFAEKLGQWPLVARDHLRLRINRGAGSKFALGSGSALPCRLEVFVLKAAGRPT